MTRDEKASAKKLAVAYESYLEALRIGDESGKRVWRQMLCEAQDETGVELLNLEYSRVSFSDWAPLYAAKVDASQ